MVTFSDVISLLVTFFVLILTFSTMEIQQFQKISGALQGGFGVMSPKSESNRPALLYRDTVMADRERRDGSETPFRRDVARMEDELRELKIKERLDEELKIEQIEGALRIRIDGDRLFDPESARLRPEYNGILAGLAEIMGYYPNPILVEGHTDSAFTGGALYPPGYELAGTMAQSVAEGLIHQGGLDPGRVGTASYGATRPIQSNGSALGRARNRRVDILILEKDA